MLIINCSFARTFHWMFDIQEIMFMWPKRLSNYMQTKRIFFKFMILFGMHSVLTKGKNEISVVQGKHKVLIILFFFRKQSKN